MKLELPNKYAVLVNVAANDGRAAQRWESVAGDLAELLPPDTQVHCFVPPVDLSSLVRELLDQGYRGFISAGGDGSANHLLNILMRHCGEHAEHLWLGGIGLGSSNDFIKPKKHLLRGLPTRMDAQNAELADVGKVEWQTETGEKRMAYFIANASMGVTAEANWQFNHGDAVIRFLKKRWTDAAILYAALSTILRHRNIPVMLSANNTKNQIQLSNLAVLKSPYVSGSFCYDDPVMRNDGKFGVNICMNMGLLALVRVLYGLSKGRFRGQSNTLSFAATSLHLHPARPAALELDGEVFQCSSAQFTVCPGAIRLMAL